MLPLAGSMRILAHEDFSATLLEAGRASVKKNGIANLPRKTLAQMKELFDEYRNRPTKSEIILLEHTRLPSAMILMRVGHCRSA
jgi:hypothetical protein